MRQVNGKELNEMKNKKTVFASMILSVLLIAGCGLTESADSDDASKVIRINAEEAYNMMNEEEVTVVDVRTREEYAAKHIEGALLLPVDQITDSAEEVLKDKEAVYLIYCRSGSRSAQAAKELVSMGYENIYDFGGIIDWPYETVSGNQ